MMDWSRLHPFRESKRKSFEELCYQLAKREYGQVGRFTSIDDSGGGDGVEFFLTTANGEEWGWQAKFFYPTPRIGRPQRRQVVDSLKRSIERHPRLTRWFLCTPTSFTTGAPGSELKWWDALRAAHSGIELVHWGDSDLSELLAQPASAGQRAFFFGEIPLSPEWFRTRLGWQLANLRDPFEPTLHALTEADMRVHFLAQDRFWIAALKQTAREAEAVLASMRMEWQKACALAETDAYLPAATSLLVSSEAALAILHHVAESAASDLAESNALVATAMAQVEEARRAFVWTTVGEFKPEMVDGTGVDPDRPLPGPLQIMLQPGSRAVQVLQLLHQSAEALRDAGRSAMHVIGSAGMGKTHGAAHACHAAISEDRPAVLLLGGRFRASLSIESQILDQLQIPRSYSWEEFTGALEAYAAACGSPALLVIDAINEAENPGLWRQNLPGLQESVAQRPHVHLVTTCRPSYLPVVWGDPPADIVEAKGFTAEVLPSVIQQYFSRYRLVVDITLSPLRQFQHPLYLKIFCESENPERAVQKEVFLGAQTLYTVLQRYLARTSRSLAAKLDLRPSERLVEDALATLCKQLWESGRRTLPIDDAMRLLDGSHPTGWERSLTRALLDEGLLIHKDLSQDEGEQVEFTYDLLGGYLIARQLLAGVSQKQLEDLVSSEPLLTRLASADAGERHPLSADVVRGLAAAAPSATGAHLFSVTSNPVLWNAGVHALFEMNPASITTREAGVVAALFSEPANRDTLLELALNTALSPKHPLNLRLWDQLLRQLSMRDCDLAWGVHVQQTLDFWEWLAAETERACRSGRSPGSHTSEKMELAVLGLRWLLTSTMRGLRDRATRALYWYGRRHPDRLAALALDSLAINDPYVPERCLAACFGVAMAFYADPAARTYQGNVLPRLARDLYGAMFAPAAPHPSTHALLRDSASGILALAVRIDQDLFSRDELDRAAAPFPRAGGRADVDRWGHADDRDRDRYRDGNEPMHMDFANYTVGGLVRARQLHDNDHPEYRKVMGQLRWRMYNLGYRFDAFGELDTRTETVALMAPAAEPRPYIERFGLKYAWIAFYDLYGWRLDRGLLPEGYHEPQLRPAEVDLDASFPDPPRSLRVVSSSLLPDQLTPLREWVERGAVPEVSSWLTADIIDGESGPWVLLDAVLDENDPLTGHGVLIMVRTAITAKRGAAALAQELAGVDPGHRGLPDPPQDRHTYAGEAPWRNTFPPNEPTPVSLAHSRTGSGRTFKVRLPIRHNAWDAHHSEITTNYQTAVLDKEIAESLGLWIRPPSWDFHEPGGRRATISLLYQDGTARHAMTWIRQDLLESWLDGERQALIWAVTGERKRSVQHPTFTRDPDPGPHYHAFAQVYRWHRRHPVRVGGPGPQQPS